jgi:hypothetical protein
MKQAKLSHEIVNADEGQWCDDMRKPQSTMFLLTVMPGGHLSNSRPQKTGNMPSETIQKDTQRVFLSGKQHCECT